MAKSSTTGASLPIDPTANVIAQFRAEKVRADDLRKADRYLAKSLRKVDEKHRLELSKADNKARVARELAEARRLNQLLEANTANVALALEKQGAQATAQDKRIAVLEQNQYSGAGGTAATDKAQARGSITLSQLITAGVLLVAVLALVSTHIKFI